MKKAMNQSLLVFILNGISILSLVFLMFSLSSYRQMNDQLNAASEDRFELTYNANRFMNGSAYLTNEVRAFAATGAQEHYDNYWNEINNLKNREQGVAALQEIGITAEEQKMIDEMSALSNLLVPLEEQSMENVKDGNMQAAIDYVYGPEYSASIAQINAIKEEFLETLDTRAAGQVRMLQEEVARLRMMMIAALAVVGVLQLFNILFTRRKILRPVITVRDQMGEIAQGNLSAEFRLQSNTSEIGMLVESIYATKRELKNYIRDINDILEQMAQGNMNLQVSGEYKGEFLPIRDALMQILDALNSALFQINLTAEQVSSESRKMASDAQILSSGAVKQASAVEELSSSIKEIAEAVEHTSQDADHAQAFSLDAMKQLQISNQKMEELTVAIEDISKASNQIGGIIKTIEDISSQTNILALNAAVEAARAGEAGKGFAVVADEVQNLANKSASSAKSITELIENSMRLVKYGTSLSEDTTNALEGVVAGAKKVTEMVDRIAESATQQSQSLKQVTLGMNQISEVVQTNASTAEKSAASANELYDQAEELKISVHKFKLRKYR
ncbi:MAG: HAMP domain-containing protein [Lachnospiraceae bacterium]|nr:HAMP domain-containing protein [Lachnospiraceae bacterium]